ncbi:hypothetical protein RJ640_021667 [Escallonia rubra]|uniref:Uncharacterized protein n=1 Tax=Escallonia rubra TaxID=112253 RepID=A0AA88U676_9ASTE|nr:hypothetical protein RJ640_021667 [Escallonia rubra]
MESLEWLLESNKSMQDKIFGKDKTYLFCFQCPDNVPQNQEQEAERTLRVWSSFPESANNKVVLPQPGGPSNSVILPKSKFIGTKVGYQDLTSPAQYIRKTTVLLVLAMFFTTRMTIAAALASKPEVGSSMNIIDGFETSSTAMFEIFLELNTFGYCRMQVSRRGIMKPPNKAISSKEKTPKDAVTDGFRNTEAIKRNDDIET